MSEPMTLILVYDENTDNFYPLKAGEKPDPGKNTYLVIDEVNRKTTLSFTPDSSLIEKRTIERRVASFIKTGYEVPGSQGLRIGANMQLEKVDPKSGKLPEILLTHGHTFGKQKLVRDEIPDYVEKEDTYEVEKGSAGTRTDVLGSKISAKNIQSTKSDPEIPDAMRKRLEEAFPQKKEPEISSPLEQASTEKIKDTHKKEEVTISSSDEHLFVLGQFVDMYIQQGFQVVVYKNEKGKYEFRTLKQDSKYYIDGNQLYKV